MDIIKEVLEHTKDLEPPPRFYYWSTLSAISAVLKDRVWVDRGKRYKLYPNIYVLLYGPSGVRKGLPINYAEEIVTKVDNTRIIDGRSSIEGVIKELSTFQTREGKPPLKDACGFMVASELSSSIIGNNQAMDIMTNFYDRQFNEKNWKYRLKNEGSALLPNPTITWLGGTNEALFKDFIPEKNLHGGLIGRMFVITESEKHTTNSLMFDSPVPDTGSIVKRLIEVSKFQGEFKIEDKVRTAIDQWYNLFDKEKAPSYKDDTGFVSRVLDFILKIGMIVAIGRRGDKEILLDDVLEGVNVITPLIETTQGVVNRVKKEEASMQKKRSLVLIYLARRPDHQEERGRLLRNLGLQLNHEDLDNIIQHFIQMNTVSIESQGSKITYKLRTDRPEIEAFVKSYKG